MIRVADDSDDPDQYQQVTTTTQSQLSPAANSSHICESAQTDIIRTLLTEEEDCSNDA